jgi:hypothetical protein
MVHFYSQNNILTPIFFILRSYQLIFDGVCTYVSLFLSVTAENMNIVCLGSWGNILDSQSNGSKLHPGAGLCEMFLFTYTKNGFEKCKQ